MNIVLIGMRGSGKTTVGKLLSQKLGRKFVDMDELIAQRLGLGISEIVERHGWERFREEEVKLTRELAQLDNVVNATGGGVVTRPENIQELKKQGLLVWLKASVATLCHRIGDSLERPSLTGQPLKEETEAVLASREPIYAQAADFVIDTENKTPEEIAEIIVKLCNERGCLEA